MGAAQFQVLRQRRKIADVCRRSIKEEFSRRKRRTPEGERVPGGEGESAEISRGVPAQIYKIKKYAGAEEEFCKMEDHQELVCLLNSKIDECDDLIVEISQLRYHLEDIIKLIDKKSGNGNPRRPRKKSSLKVVV